jgi:hypothetical protein
MPDKLIGFTQSSYPAYYLPSDEDYKTLSFVISPQRWVKGLKYTNSCCFFYQSGKCHLRILNLYLRILNLHLSSPICRFTGFQIFASPICPESTLSFTKNKFSLKKPSRLHAAARTYLPAICCERYFLHASFTTFEKAPTWRKPTSKR